MPNNNSIFQALAELNKKLDELIATLPQTYVSIRAHDLQIKAHEDKITDLSQRLHVLETWRTESAVWANDQHIEMRREWTAELKPLDEKLDGLDGRFISLTERVNVLVKVLLWILGVFTTVSGGVLIAYLTHFFH